MHAQLINALGGNSAVAKALGTSVQAVCNWSARGKIAWPYRSAVAKLAAEKGIDIPKGFLGADNEEAA